MARPYKARRICSVPAIDTFGPLNQEMDSAVELTLEEYETIRLIDWLDCTQEQCADQMGVARTALAQAGIELYPGASGDADQAVEALLNGSLDYDPNTMCSHHHEGGEHNCHGHGHSCGGHN